MTTLAPHNFLIRITTETGELVFQDADFAEEARFDWFDQCVRETAEPGELVQLIDLTDHRVIAEERP